MRATLFALVLITQLTLAQKPDTAFVLVEKDLITEGITHSRKLNTFFIGSLYKNKIIAIKDNVVRDFTAQKQFGAKAYLGLKIHPRTNDLWAASWGKYTPEEPWTAALFQFDTQSGKLLGKFTLSDTTAGFNDFTFDAKNTIYLTDTGTGAIHAKRDKSNTPELFFAKGTFSSPNGITFSNGFLIIADEKGLWRVNLTTKEKVKLEAPSGVEVGGIDGLSMYGRQFVAVRNGILPRKVMFLTPDKDLTKILSVTYLDEQGDAPRKNFSPTTGVVVDDKYYYLSNSQVRSFDADGKIFPLAQLEPVYVKVVELNHIPDPSPRR